MPKREGVAWEGEPGVAEEENAGRQSILSEMAAGVVTYSIELQDPKVHTSMVWRYFGVLLRDGIPLPSEASCNFCALCLQDGMLFKYSKATANGNLLRHLKCAHHLEVEARRKKDPKDSKRTTPRPPPKKVPKRDTEELSREICLWLSRDLRPLTWMQSEGQKHFLQRLGLVADFDAPQPSVTYLTALNEVHARLEKRVRELITAHAQDEFHLSVECTRYSARHARQVSCSLHWVNAEWSVRHVNLGTSVIGEGEEERVVGERLKEFGVERVMYVVGGEGGGAVVSGMERLPCMATCISDLVTKDLLQMNDNVDEEDERKSNALNVFGDALRKLRVLHREMLFHLETLETQIDYKNGNYLKEFQESYSRIDSLLESEERVGENGSSSFSWIVNWHLCDHFLKYNDIFESLSLKSVMITPSDYKYVTLLKVILGDVLSATQILSGSRYSSLSSSLLFRSEIIDSIGKHCAECDREEVIGLMWEGLQQGVGCRLVMNEAVVCAAIVDPAMKQLGIIDQYMFALNISKQEFIKNMVIKHKLLPQPTQENHFNLKLTMNEEEMDENQRAKKLRLQLLSKHCNTEALSSLDLEIRKYLLVSEVVDEPLAWWRLNGDAFPYIRQLARLYLAIPAMALPFQRAFTVAGVAESAARTSLPPTLSKKMLFIHDNYHTLCPHNDAITNV